MLKNFSCLLKRSNAAMAYMQSFPYIWVYMYREKNLSLDVSAVNRFFAATAISSLPLTHFPRMMYTSHST